MPVIIPKNPFPFLVRAGDQVANPLSPILADVPASSSSASDALGKVDPSIIQAYVKNYSVPGDVAVQPLGTENPTYSDEFPGTALDKKWVWINQGSSTATVSLHRMRLVPQVSGSTLTNNVRLLTQTVPSGNWSLRTQVAFTGDTINCGGGLVAYRSNTGDLMFQSVLSATTGERLLSAYWTSVTTFGTIVRDDNPPVLQERVVFMQMRYDGTTFFMDHSFDNLVYFNLTSVNATTAIGGAPTSFGLAGNAPKAADPTAPILFRWFRCFTNANLNQ